MIAANAWVDAHPLVALPGGARRFFDIVAIASITGMLLILLVTTVRNTARLYREEHP